MLLCEAENAEDAAHAGLAVVAIKVGADRGSETEVARLAEEQSAQRGLM